MHSRPTLLQADTNFVSPAHIWHQFTNKYTTYLIRCFFQMSFCLSWKTGSWNLVYKNTSAEPWHSGSCTLVLSDILKANPRIIHDQNNWRLFLLWWWECHVIKEALPEVLQTISPVCHTESQVWNLRCRVTYTEIIIFIMQPTLHLELFFQFLSPDDFSFLTLEDILSTFNDLIFTLGLKTVFWSCNFFSFDGPVRSGKVCVIQEHKVMWKGLQKLSFAPKKGQRWKGDAKGIFWQ